jgi:hypothetical protein
MNDELPPPVAASSIGFDSNLADNGDVASPPAFDQSQAQDALAPEAVDAVFQTQPAQPAEPEKAEVPLWAWAGIIALPLEKKRDARKISDASQKRSS